MTTGFGGRSPGFQKSLSFFLAIALSTAISSPVTAQSHASLEPVCVGIKSKEQGMTSNLCCQQAQNSRCFDWQQIFLQNSQHPPVVILKSQPPEPAASSNQITTAVLKIVGREATRQREASVEEFAGNVASQMALQAGTAFLMPKLVRFATEVTPSGMMNLINQLQAGYKRAFLPRELGSGVILTPKLNINVDPLNLRFNSAGVGAKVEF